jgi:KDO2-lipid IV(A) lauroyltransferase
VTNPYSLTAAHVRGISYSWRRATDAAARGAFSLSRIVASGLPRFALTPLAGAAALAQIVFSPHRAKAYYRNLEFILPEGRKSRPSRSVLTFKALRSYGLFLLEFLKISRMGPVFMRDFSFDGLGEMDRALETGRGVILIATHLGNWEAGARALAYAGYRIHIVVGVQLNRSLSPCMKALKREVGVGVVSPAPGEYRRLIEALRENEIVVLAVDGDTFEKGLEVPFFSARTRTAAGPARLAALTGAPIVSTHVLRKRPMRFQMKIRTLWDGANGPALSPKAPDFVTGLTEYLMRSLEGPIASNLDQWCIFRPLWKKKSK